MLKNVIFEHNGEVSVRRTPLESGRIDRPDIKVCSEKFCILPRLSTIMFYSYILKSLKDGKYYYGSAENLDLRLIKHNKGDVRSTKGRRPFVLHYFEMFSTRSEAFRREHFYKSIEGYIYLKQNNII